MYRSGYHTLVMLEKNLERNRLFQIEKIQKKLFIKHIINHNKLRLKTIYFSVNEIQYFLVSLLRGTRNS